MRLLLVALVLAGCTTYLTTPAPSPSPSCVLLTTNPYTDSLTVAIYSPPCDRRPDSLIGWRVPAPLGCPLVGIFDPVTTRGTVRPSCPRPSVPLRGL